MSDLRQWVAVDEAGTVVHAGMGATQDFVDNFNERVVDDESKTTPFWWHEGVEFFDVTDENPRPITGWTRDEYGAWLPAE